MFNKLPEQPHRPSRHEREKYRDYCKVRQKYKYMLLVDTFLLNSYIKNILEDNFYIDLNEKI